MEEDYKEKIKGKNGETQKEGAPRGGVAWSDHQHPLPLSGVLHTVPHPMSTLWRLPVYPVAKSSCNRQTLYVHLVAACQLLEGNLNHSKEIIWICLATP